MSMGRSNWVHIHIEEIIKETDLAFLVAFNDGEQEWIPRSQVADPDEYKEGDADITLSVTEYIAKEKGLEKYEG